MEMPHIKFRDLNPGVVLFVKESFPEWDASVGDILGGAPADAIVSPANCIGRMDGGIDGLYVRRFGWQLQARLAHHLVENHGGRDDLGRLNGSSGRVEIGNATAIHTGHPLLPLMIMAPTMDWPPGEVAQTQNAYLAMRAVLLLARLAGVKSILMPGLATATGRMSGEVCAAQMRRAWDEVAGSLAGT